MLAGPTGYPEWVSDVVPGRSRNQALVALGDVG
jgi:hypothetical protein